MKWSKTFKRGKLCTLLFIFLLIGGTLVAQTTFMVSYTYDASGNRTSRTCQEIGMNSLKMGDDTTSFNAEDIERTLKENERYESLDGETRFILYPNPTKGRMLVKISPFTKDYIGSKLSIIDMSGKILSSVEVKENITIVDLRSYDKGNYVLLMECKDKNRQWKIVKN